MRHIEFIVKASEKHTVLVVQLMLVNAAELGRQTVFLDAVVIIKSCLSTPANVESAVHVALAPLHDFAELVPVLNFFKFHHFHRCACDNQTVVIFMLDLIESLIEGNHVLL